jgi:mevalonate kinase
MLVPGKTFLTGEYIALQGEPSLIFSSQPMFELSVSFVTDGEVRQALPFHPDSPAGCWFEKYKTILERFDFAFNNPYQIGGLGASSAEFLALYRLTQHLLKKEILHPAQVITDYHSVLPKQALKPSGADIIGQYCQGITIYRPKENRFCAMDWQFDDLSLLLFHTGKKLATHEHLSTFNLQFSADELIHCSARAIVAYENRRVDEFIEAIQSYGQLLKQQHLLAEHSQVLLEQIARMPHVLASKGCGAMGADVLLVLCESSVSQDVIEQVAKLGIRFLASEKDIALPYV